MNGLRTGIVGAAGVALLAVLATCVLVVDETEHAVVTQFGRPVSVYSQAGLRGKLPWPVQRISRFDRRVLLTETDETELLTADKKNVVLTTYVSWRVADPLAYLIAVRSREFAEARLTALLQSELGSALGELAFDRLISAGADREGIAALEKAVIASSTTTAEREYGIELVDFGITRLMFPSQNLQSVFARMRAERARIARGYRSEGRAEAQKIRAEADRKRSEALATAESQATRTRGDGEAEAARVYADAYRGHEAFYRFLRTLETYEKVLGDKTTLVLPADSPFLELLTQRAPEAWRGGPLENGQQ